MWQLLCVFYSITLQLVCGKLVGDHICLTEESYKINVTEHYIRQATVRNYKWCLNVPPRCSYYTIKNINDTRIVESNKTRVVEKCCPEFFEKDEHCVSYCDACENGICIENICQCAPGFGGINCDSKCSIGLWGSNCTNVCECTSEFCNPVNGSCTPHFDINTESEDDYYNADTTTLNANLYEMFTANTITSNFYEDPRNQTTETESLGTYLEHVTELYDNYIDNTTEERRTLSTFSSSSTNAPSTNSTRNSKNNTTLDRYKSEVQNILGSSTKRKKQDKMKVLQNLKTDIEIIPVGIQYDQIAKPLLQDIATSSTSVIEESNYVEEDSKTESSNKIISKEYYFINSISVSAATTVALILLAAVIFTIRKKHKLKENVDNKKSVGVSTVAVYTTSIFHTPLPDPPICENPSYLMQMECQNYLNEPSVETHVIYSMNTPNQLKTGCKNYEYDYPPSTGSYRAASLIEPLDIDTNQRNHFVQTEPVYDEIPCRGGYESVAETPYENQPMALYINTSDITK